MNFDLITPKNRVPVVPDGLNVFLRRDYEAHLGCSDAGKILTKLQAEGTVQKVLVKRGGKLIAAWQYLPASRKAKDEQRTGLPRT